MDNPQGWYVVRTKAGGDREAVTAIREAGLKVWAPVERRLRRSRSGRVERQRIVETPAFPGYVFIRATVAGADRVHTLKGVQTVLGRVPQEDYIRLLVVSAMGGWDYTPKRKTYQRGEAVTIVRGPFTGWKAKFQSERAADRVAVLVQVVGRGGGEWPAELDRADLEAA